MITRRFFNRPTTGWHHPFTELEKMSQRMNQLSHMLLRNPEFKFMPARVFPAVNITEDSENYYLRAELPSIAADDINVEVTGRNLTLSGERRSKVEGENIKYHRKERETGKFSRVIEFPGDIDGDAVKAKLRHGILTVTLAKSESSKPRQISVG